MAQNRKPGMCLRQTLDPPKNTNWLLRLMMSMAGTTALLLMAAGLAGFRLGSTMLILLLAGGLFCGAYGVLNKSRRPQWFAPGVLVILLLLVVIFRQQVLEGWRLCWNRLSVTMVASKGWVLPKLECQLPAGQQAVSISLLAVLVSGCTSLVCCILADCAPLVLAVLPTAVLLAGMAWLGIGSEFSLLVPVLVLSVMVLLCCGWKNRQAAAQTLVAWGICVVAVFAAVQIFSAPGITDWTRKIGDGVQQKLHHAQYETEHTTLPEGSFADYRVTSRKAEPALEVTMGSPELLYLRGFTGTVFSRDVWSALDTEELSKNAELLYWLNLNAFTPDSQFAAAAEGLETERNRITIKNTGACSKYLYVPFSLVDGDYLYKENLNTDGAFGSGERSYSYSALTGGADAISLVLSHLKSSEEEAVLAYRKAESAYRKVVYTQYLQVPDEVKELLVEQWDDLAARYGGITQLTMEQGQECALRFLGSCFPESGIPEGQALPLDQARGTPYQYATVAVMTLRYFGIPARYAEGYLITEQLAQRAVPGEAITVDSSCAWAWAEIYQDGIGWIPVDLTPGLGEVIEEQPDNSLTGDLEGESEEEEEDSEDDADSTPQAPETLGGTVVRILKRSFAWIFWLLLILSGLFLLLWLRRKKRLEKKERKFRYAEVRNAVGWIIADTIELIDQMGISRENGSLRSLSEPVKRRFGEAYAQEFEKIIELNDRAVFSGRRMEDTCRETALSFRQETLNRLKAETKWYRRLVLKWLKCLY